MDPSGLAQQVKQAGHQENCLLSTSAKDTANIPDNRRPNLGTPVPNLSLQNLIRFAAASGSNQIAQVASFAGCSTSMLNAMHENTIPYAAPSAFVSHGADQHAGPSIQPFGNLPEGYSRVPINILVLKKRQAGSEVRPQLPFSQNVLAPAFPQGEQDGPVQLAPNHFLLLGRPSNMVASDTALTPLAPATPVKYKLADSPRCFQQRDLDTEMPKAGTGKEASRLQQSAIAVDENSGSKPVTPITPVKAKGLQGQHARELTDLAGGSFDDNMQKYQTLPKQTKTQINQSDDPTLSTPTVSIECTKTLPEIRQTEISNNEKETPGRKQRPQRKKHRPKVIGEGKPAKTRKAAVATPEVKPPNQTAKRSYVRKKRSLSSLENSSEPISGKSNGSKAGSTASVRRKLHFEHEERAASGEQPSMVNTWHIKPEKLPHPQRPECSVTKSAIQIGQGLPVAVENSLGELAFGLSRRMNKMLDEYICFPEATSKATPDNPPAASGCFSRAMMVDDLGQLAMKQDNIGSTHNPDKTGQSVLHTEGRLGKTFTEGKRRNLELNSSNVDDLQIYRSVTSLSERESVLNQISKVQQVEKWNHEQHNNGGFTTAGGQDSVSLRTAAEMLTLCQAGGTKKKRSVQACRLSFTPIKNLEDSTLEASQKSSRSCLEALYESTHIKFMTKKRSQKARLHSPSSVESKMQHKKRVSTESIFLGGSNGSSASEGTFQGTLPSAMSSYIPDNKSISLDICRKVPNKSLASTSIAPYMDSLQSVAWNLKYLDLNAEQIHRTEMKLSAAASHTICLSRAADPANALVPYVSRAVVPHKRPLHLVKKQRPRAKVDLDNESTRVWKLLMGKSVDPADGTDDEKEKWWKQEREVFQSRANAFIARMRLVQGDRRFSPWKGSVVDSVVGVFLTQNVADHLSSSAFMALAASFPPRSINSNSKDGGGSKYNGEVISTNAVQDESMIHFFENSVQLDIDVHCEDFSVTYEKTHTDPKDNTGANELVKGDRYSCYDEASNGSLCNHQGTGMTPNGQQFAESSPIELAASTKNALEMTFHQEIDYSQSILTTQTIPPSRLTLSSGKDCAPGNFVGDLGDTAPQELRSNSNGGKALVGNVAAIDEVPCKRFRMATKTDDVYHPGISSGSMFCPLISNIDRPKTDERNKLNVSSTPPYGSSGSASLIMKDDSIDKDRSLFISIDAPITTNNGNKNVDVTLHFSETSTEPTVKLHHNIMNGFEASDLQEHKSSSSSGGMITEIEPTANEFCLKSGATSYCGAPDTAANISKPAKTMAAGKNTESFDWDSLRRQACSNGYKKERSSERRDSIDWEAVRCADVHRISHAIRDRGMNNVLAERIQNFLNRLVRDHGSIDLEWLRDIPPDSAKDYLLSIRGLGLKSAECVRLLTLHHLAFPVDTNVGRICVRLGWVPIQPLPESLQLHLLELYPVQETIQKYLWPRLCILDQQTLYELHYQMITFGKVFCTKNKPNCNACPMRSECKHFASAFASARLALPAPQDKNIVNSINQFVFQNAWMPALKSTAQPQLEGRIHARDLLMDNSMPIIEEPASPREKESPGTLENEIEDFYEDSDEIPTIKLNIEAFAQNLEDCIKESNKDLQTEDIAKALVAISSEAASIPVPKLKNVNRLRTEHYVYELPDSHPLVQQLELDQREPDDPSPYLLIIRMADETKETSKARKSCCNSQVEGRLCNNEMCHACVSEREIQSRYVSGTILVPCRTAMRGSFPLNGTYFQVNEVFADHNSSHNPILVLREQLWNLQRRMVYFGTSVPTIFKGLTTEEIQQCFWRGFVCVRGFDRETRAPKPLCPHLHIAASKLPRTRRAEKMNR